MSIVPEFQGQALALSYLSQRNVSVHARRGCFWNLWSLGEVPFTPYALAGEGCVVLEEESRPLQPLAAKTSVFSGSR